MKSVKKSINRTTKSKQQHIKSNKKGKASATSKKTTNAERVFWEDMNQIEWFPIDPYCD